MPRGRPRSFDIEESLDTAEKLFWDNGLSATSLDDLAAATSIARPSLKAAFGDKVDLYLKVIARFADRMALLQEPFLLGENPLGEDLRGIYRTFLGVYCEGPHRRGCLVVCTLPVESIEEPRTRMASLEIMRSMDLAFQRRFDIAVKQRELPRHSDTAALGRMAAAFLQSLALRSRAGIAEKELLELVDTGVSLLTGSVKNAPIAKPRVVSTR